MTYQLINNFKNQLTCIKQTFDGTPFTKMIPIDESNTDYQKYLEWVAEGNTPEAAD